MLWAYISFSQYLIIWSGNIPEEARYYDAARRPAGSTSRWSLVMFHFFVPFVLLLWRRTKRNPSTLAVVARSLLVMRLVDLFWVIVPSFALRTRAATSSPRRSRARDRSRVGATTWWHAWMFPAAAAAIGGVWVAGVRRRHSGAARCCR